jgi:hypothetical protein
MNTAARSTIVQSDCRKKQRTEFSQLEEGRIGARYYLHDVPGFRRLRLLALNLTASA